RGFKLPRWAVREHLAERRPLVGAMPSTQFSDDRFLSREVLVERRDVDAGALGDSIRREFRVPLPNQNVSRRLEQRLDGRGRSLLPRRFSGRKPSLAHRLSIVWKCKLTQYKQLLIFVSMTNECVPTQRRVARATRAGGPEVLAVAVEDLRPLKIGEALVRVEAVGLNHVESLVRSGTYSIRFEFPFDVGVEGAGTVVAVGGVAIAPGTRVCWT